MAVSKGKQAKASSTKPTNTGIDLRKRRSEVAALARKLAEQMLPQSTGAVDWRAVTRKCPNCKISKKVEPFFGVRLPPSGVQKAQSWCVNCRSKTNYHAEN